MTQGLNIARGTGTPPGAPPAVQEPHRNELKREHGYDSEGSDSSSVGGYDPVVKGEIGAGWVTEVLL